ESTSSLDAECSRSSTIVNDETIRRRLGEIETANNVRILFAAESGSRAWGFSSPDSDYDVRFIYVHPLDWYLTITPGRDTIERLDADGFDASGWDIRKALGLFGRTNLTMIEWINSPIIYADDNVLRPALLALLPVYFNKTRALYHYYHIATNHKSKYLERRGVELKRYLYFVRSLLACVWIEENGTPPPVPFAELVCAEVKETEVREELDNIVRLKRSGKEHNKEIVSDVLRCYGAELEERVMQIMSTSASGVKIYPDKESKLNRLLCDIITGRRSNHPLAPDNVWRR
ncbi:MAG: nucleotidyltransferase domain-containing protein, partial [Prevotella sp.]|nr:nucleotidyltransferase domain-containing protein [Prevotella sp.]